MKLLGSSPLLMATVIAISLIFHTVKSTSEGDDGEENHDSTMGPVPMVQPTDPSPACMGDFVTGDKDYCTPDRFM